jgi:hypothetical protein
MSSPYKVTLLQLKADLSATGTPADKIELGALPPAEIFALAGKLLKITPTGQPIPEPAIIVRRGDKGWRIAVHNGLLRMHKSASAFDDYWTVHGPEGLTELPPFRNNNSTPPIGSKSSTAPRSTTRRSGFRTMLEVTGLIGVGVVLIAVGLWYGVPHRRLSDVPADVVILSSIDERDSLFKAVAGTYASGKKPGDSIIVITEQGQVSLAALGRNGQPITPPRVAEAARAARRKNANCLVTSFGVISASEPDVVTMGAFKLTRSPVN